MYGAGRQAGALRTAEGSGLPAPQPGVSAAPAANPNSGFSSPPSVNTDTAVNPMQQSAYNSASDYEKNVAAGTNEETQRELGRARDEISVGMKAEGEGAMSRGADPSLFRSRALSEGARNMSNLQGRLADVSLGRRAEAIGLKTGAASSAAGEQRLMHLGTMSQRLNEQRAETERAETQARLDQGPYDRMMQMMQNVGNYRDAYAGFGTGSTLFQGGYGGSGAYF